MITKHRKILNLIVEIRNAHPEMENIFLYGSCLNFHIILRTVFPEAIAYYNVDHIITKIDGKHYDITGQVLNTKGYLPFSDYYDKKGASRAFKQMYNANYQIK